MSHLRGAVGRSSSWLGIWRPADAGHSAGSPGAVPRPTRAETAAWRAATPAIPPEQPDYFVRPPGGMPNRGYCWPVAPPDATVVTDVRYLVGSPLPPVAPPAATGVVDHDPPHVRICGRLVAQCAPAQTGLGQGALEQILRLVPAAGEQLGGSDERLPTGVHEIAEILGGLVRHRSPSALGIQAVMSQKAPRRPKGCAGMRKAPVPSGSGAFRMRSTA